MGTDVTIINQPVRNCRYANFRSLLAMPQWRWIQFMLNLGVCCHVVTYNSTLKKTPEENKQIVLCSKWVTIVQFSRAKYWGLLCGGEKRPTTLKGRMNMEVGHHNSLQLKQWCTDAVSYRFMSLIEGACTWLWSPESGFLEQKRRDLFISDIIVCGTVKRWYVLILWNHEISQSRLLTYLEFINTQVEGPQSKETWQSY